MFLISKFSLDTMSPLDKALSINIYPISQARAEVMAPNCIPIINLPAHAETLKSILNLNDCRAAKFELKYLSKGDMCLFGDITYIWNDFGENRRPIVKWFLIVIGDVPIDNDLVYADHDNDEV